MTLRKQYLDTPWPPNDRSVGVILVAHSMGGFVASDALFETLDERRRSSSPSALTKALESMRHTKALKRGNRKPPNDKEALKL
ncbi:hypothetical protein QBC47DRAFT_385677 [Echria macrotheca]|uniref:Uncharacterized protein n=1 Tax=Echria macrotheca TaxID=438768 RepID=A0AAJ0B9D4_9PEZI|nr:hypothetical protein QBC47DRAFT_385677 [Echria macrotheca]